MIAVDLETVSVVGVGIVLDGAAPLISVLLAATLAALLAAFFDCAVGAAVGAGAGVWVPAFTAAADFVRSPTAAVEAASRSEIAGSGIVLEDSDAENVSSASSTDLIRSRPSVGAAAAVADDSVGLAAVSDGTGAVDSAGALGTGSVVVGLTSCFTAAAFLLPCFAGVTRTASSFLVSLRPVAVAGALALRSRAAIVA